jgi:dihydrofolate reductase
MRKLILKMSMTVDGFVALPNGEQPWIYKTGIEDKESAQWTLDTIRAAGSHVMGSKTFRDMASYWPYSTEAFAEPMNSVPKVVFSHHPIPGDVTKRSEKSGKAQPTEATLASWRGPRVASGALADEIAKLKSESGGPLVAYGGASFAQSLVREHLPDEIHLLVHPVAIGRGLPVFSSLAEPMWLELVEAKRFPLGGVGHVYRKQTKG